MQCRHHGTTFFPDFQHQQHASDFMYSTFSLPHPNHDPAFHEAESGQLVIDRLLPSRLDLADLRLQHL